MIEVTLRPSEVQRSADCELAGVANSSTLAPLVEAAGYTLHDTPLHVAAPIGSGVHRGIEAALRGKMIARPVPERECIDAGVARYEQEIEERGGYSNMKWDQTSKPSDAPKQIARMIKAWLVFRLPEITPVEIEHRRTILIYKSQHMRVRLSGQLDIGLDLPSAIHDVKTTAEVKHCGVQLGQYRLLREHVTKRTVDALAIEHITRLPMSKEQTPPRVIAFDADACLQEAKATLTRAIAALGDFFSGRLSEPRLAFRANPNSPLCSYTWCRAHGTDFCPISKLRIAA